MKTILFFNNKGGVGKTTVVYHVAWMLSQMGIKTVAVDLDPQANLTYRFLGDERLLEIEEKNLPVTVFHSFSSMISGGGNYKPVHIEPITDNLGLVLGDLSLSGLESVLSTAWLQSFTGDQRSFELVNMFNLLISDVAARFSPEIVLIDVAPNLASINRAIILSSDHIVIPSTADFFSLKALESFGKMLKALREDWRKLLTLPRFEKLSPIFSKSFIPAGYVIMQVAVRGTRLSKFSTNWMNRICVSFYEYILNAQSVCTIANEDQYCLGLIRQYYSLEPMAIEVRKPVFLLTPGDGAFGVQMDAVHMAYLEYEKLTERIIHL